MKPKPRYPGVVVRLTDDRYASLGHVGSELRKAGAKQDEINQYYTDARRGDFARFINVTSEWVTLIGPEAEPSLDRTMDRMMRSKP